MNEIDDNEPDSAAVLPRDLRDEILLAVRPREPEPAIRERLGARLQARIAEERLLVPATSRTDTQAGTTTVRADEGQWITLLPKVRMKLLHASEDGMQSYLLKLDPGALVPPHHHPESEECIVLEGSATIALPHKVLTAHQGDYHLARAGQNHPTIYTDERALLFLRGPAPSGAHVRWGAFLASGAAWGRSLKKLAELFTGH